MVELVGPKRAGLEFRIIVPEVTQVAVARFRSRTMLGGACLTVTVRAPLLPMSDSFRLTDNAPSRRLLYTGALLLIVIPFLQAGQQLWPLQLSDIRWRFGAANALSSVLLLPFLGLMIVTLTARATENKRVSGAVGIVAALFVIGLVGSLFLFALDALQLKSIVTSQMMNPFQTTSLRVVLVTLVFMASFSMLMVSAFKNSRGDTPNAKKGAKNAEEGLGLIVGQPT